MGPRATRYIRRALLCGALALVVLAESAPAGPLGLPIPSPGPLLRNTVETVRDTVNRTTDALTGTVDQTLGNVTHDLAGRPIDPALFEQDDKGARVVQGVLLAIGLSESGRAAAEALDIEVARREDLDALDLEVARLKLPPGLSALAAIKALRAADPQGVYDFDHIYDPTGDFSKAVDADPAPVTRVAHGDAKIGMIDSGIDSAHPAFHDADITVKVTIAKKGAAAPTNHGTAVASLLVGEDRDFRGALAGAELYAADAFGGSSTGGAADDIARAIAWLVGEDVPVINISVTGPDNALLAAAVRAAVKRGHIIVAAVGNDGPAVDVKYPAAYAGVVAVTSVDANKRIQIDANRGPAIAFAARGVGVRVAQVDGAYGTATGTSYASPIVAARFAEILAKPDASSADDARRSLIALARAPNGRTRDHVYGYGVLEPRRGGEVSAAR